MHRSEVLANLTAPMRALTGMVERGELASLLAGDPRANASSHHRHQRRLAAADVDQLGVYRDGLGSIYDLAERWGVHRNTIARHLKERGVRLGPFPLRDSEAARAREPRGQGFSLNAIGRALGRDPKTVKNAIGVEVRRRQPPQTP